MRGEARTSHSREAPFKLRVYALHELVKIAEEDGWLVALTI